MTESPSPLTMLFSRHTRRRTFIAGLGSAATWPVVALGQQPERMRRSGAFGSFHRKLIITLAAKHQLPALYPFRFFVTDGGLISFGYDVIDNYRCTAGYVDRILRGEKPADLPVQAPTKFEMAVNVKTAEALGLTIPETLLATADEVIQ
jgi:hypothetical protein